MKLAIATDAISADFETAVLLGLEWGIESFELKRVHHKRVPDVTDDEVKIVEKVLRANEVTISTLSPGLFKGPLEAAFIEQELGPRLDMTVRLADRCRTRSIIIFGFDRDDRRTEGEAIRQIIDVFGRLAARAEREGLTLFLENDRNLWAETPEALLAIIEGVSSPALRLNWDPCNLVGAYAHAPYPFGYSLIHELVGHVHVKDASVNADGKVAHAMVGSGDVDWVGQFAQLMADGYDGYCVIEPHFGSRVSSSRDHILATRRLLRLARARMHGRQA